MNDSDNDGFAPIADGGSDCDDTDPDLNALDADGDGQSTCDGDCDDSNQFISLGEGAEDDNICSTDLDKDGFAPIADGGRDCDDTDPDLNALDADGDGQSTCDGDCDDSDPLSYTGG